jgi:hypothetical protein
MKRIRIAIVLFAACAGLAALASCKGAYTGDNSSGLLPGEGSGAGGGSGGTAVVVTDANFNDLLALLLGSKAGKSIDNPINVVVKVKDQSIMGATIGNTDTYFTDPLYNLWDAAEAAKRYVSIDLSDSNITNTAIGSRNISGNASEYAHSVDANYVVGLKLPTALTALATGAFAGMKNLKSVNFGNSQLTSIPDYAFYHSGLSGNLVLPEGIISCSDYSFDGIKVTSVTFPSTMKSTFDGEWVNKAYKTHSFGDNPNLRTVKLNCAGGGNVAGVDDAAFSGDTNLTTIIVLGGSIVGSGSYFSPGQPKFPYPVQGTWSNVPGSTYVLTNVSGTKEYVLQQ